MTLISGLSPDGWRDLETTVAAILAECDMAVQRGVRIQLPRGHVDVDVLAEETAQDIKQTIVCECKDWSSNVPQEKVHAFRTVMNETGANRGYIITRKGFQQGAIAAAVSTNVELVTFEQFQERYFTKWFKSRIGAIKKSIGEFNTYYEVGPSSKPGYELLVSDSQRAEYDIAWNRYYFAGALLTSFSPYLYMVGNYPLPSLPLDVSRIEGEGFIVPDDIKTATGYREILSLLENYARLGLEELRPLNPRRNGAQVVKQVDERGAPLPRPE
ncbi:restriction endonuclease [Nocardia rhamnosiphila]